MPNILDNYNHIIDLHCYIFLSSIYMISIQHLLYLILLLSMKAILLSILMDIFLDSNNHIK
jgi:hypothetical protein